MKVAEQRRAARTLLWSRVGWGVLAGLFLIGVGCTTEEPPVATPRQASQAKVRFDRAKLTASLQALGLDVTGGEREEARVRELLDPIECAIPDEVAMLLASQADPSTRLAVDGLRGIGAARAVAVYDSLRQFHRWRPNWIPVARGDAGWLAVESSRASSPAGPVVWVEDGGQARVRAANLTELAGQWSER